ncbi:hypothetical protein E2I00_019834, partial [Balaenoptera physalus]
ASGIWGALSHIGKPCRQAVDISLSRPASGGSAQGLGGRWSPCCPEHYGPEYLHTEDSTVDRLCPTDKPAVDITLNFLQK